MWLPESTVIALIKALKCHTHENTFNVLMEVRKILLGNEGAVNKLNRDGHFILHAPGINEKVT